MSPSHIAFTLACTLLLMGCNGGSDAEQGHGAEDRAPVIAPSAPSVPTFFEEREGVRRVRVQDGRRLVLLSRRPAEEWIRGSSRDAGDTYLRAGDARVALTSRDDNWDATHFWVHASGVAMLLEQGRPVRLGDVDLPESALRQLLRGFESDLDASLFADRDGAHGDYALVLRSAPERGAHCEVRVVAPLTDPRLRLLVEMRVPGSGDTGGIVSPPREPAYLEFRGGRRLELERVTGFYEADRNRRFRHPTPPSWWDPERNRGRAPTRVCDRACCASLQPEFLVDVGRLDARRDALRSAVARR